MEIVGQVFDAFNSGNIERMLAFTHPNCEVEIPPNLSAEPDSYRGHDGMRRYFESFQDAMKEIRLQPERYWQTGDVVVVDMLGTAKGRRTAIPVELRTAGIWTICDRKVIRVQVYASVSEALEAVGLAE